MEGVLGSYRIVRKLGEGGMGAVYLAEHALLGRRAAVKVLQPALSANQDIVQRFFNEARAATAIADPGIVQIFDFGYHQSAAAAHPVAYIVMEFLEGEALDARVRRLGRLPPADALRILRQVASSLGAAHARGIVHRDLKPENVFLVPDREVAGGERIKLLDFGIAKLTGDTAAGGVKTHTAAIMGTPMYMSPEQCRGAGGVDHRSDLYALGCVLYHLLVGAPPFLADGIGEIIAAHLREPAPPPSCAVPGIPPSVDALVLRLLAKHPADRFATAGELAATIDALLAGGLHAPVAGIGVPVDAGAVTLSNGAPNAAMAVSYPGLPSLGAQTPVPGMGSHTPLPLTTLSGSAGIPGAPHSTVAPRKRGALLAIGAAVVAAIAVMVAIIATSGSSGSPTTPSAAPSKTDRTNKPADPAAAIDPSTTDPKPAIDPAAARTPAIDPAADPAPADPTAAIDPSTATAPTAPSTSTVGSAPPAGAGSGSSRTTRRPPRTRPGAPPITPPPPTTGPPTLPPRPATAGVPGDKDGDGIPDER